MITHHLRIVFVAVVLLALGACQAPTSRLQYEADQANYEAIAPEYLAYVNADPALDEPQKERRRRTVQDWATRLEAQATALGVTR